MWDARLKGVEAVVERERRPLTEGCNGGFLLRGEHGRARLTRPHRGIFDGRTLALFSHRLSIEVVALSQARYAFLTMLYRSTQCRSRAGAAV